MDLDDIEEGFDAGPWNNVVTCRVCGKPAKHYTEDEYICDDCAESALD